MGVTRTQLSSYTDGRPHALSFSSSDTLHTVSSSGTHYVYVSMYNMGALARDVKLAVAGSSTSSEMTVTLRGGAKNTQLVLPGLPLYNPGSGVTVSASLAHTSAGAAVGWSFPTALADSITVSNGQVVGLSTTGISVVAGSQPVLVVVTDARRGATDVDPSKGTTAIIELNAISHDVITVSVLHSGRDFSTLQLVATPHSGVIATGYVLQE
jgi:hypothetical protein